MRSKLIFVAIPLLAICTYAQAAGTNSGIQATTYSDGVLFEADNRKTDLQLTIAGPGNSRSTQRYSAADPVFIDINDTNGQPLPDGLYKYEAWPIPEVTYTREESSAMPDRNSLENTTGSGVSAVSGSFRIVNGLISDPELMETAQ